MRISVLVLVICGLWSSSEAAEPKSLVELFNRVPEPPATAQEAVRWFDQSGALIHPGLLALKADIEANKRASEAAPRKDAAAALAATTQGLENVGVDVARLQKDPAYAKEMQERIMKMSPQEQMAFVQKMTQPQTQASLRDTQAAAQEPPAVQAAVDAAKRWPDRQKARSTAHITFWKESDDAIQHAAQRPVSLAKPKIEYDSIGCDNPCHAQWRAYGEKLWPIVLDREREILQARRAALQRDRVDLSAMLKEGDTLLASTRFGAAALSQVDRTYITGYHAGLLGEIDRLVDETQTAAKRAADIANAGVERLFWAGAR
jgi:hypothetical protein